MGGERRWEGEVGEEVDVFVFANSRIALRIFSAIHRYCLKMVTHTRTHTLAHTPRYITDTILCLQGG